MMTAKVFMTGRSQAVRIPKPFRFTSREVFVRRNGDSIILSPVRDRSWTEFFAHHACPDFTLDRTTAQRIQERNLFG